MKEQLLHFFNQYPHLAFVISVFINVIIAVLGVVPSFFITAANLLFFGFWEGTLVSISGEALGAIIAFGLYRKGFKKVAQQKAQKHQKLQRLLRAEGKEAFSLIMFLRLIPFVPSGLITFTAAIGSVTPLVFLIASTLGKAIALLIEVYSIYQVTKFNWQGKLILVLVAAFLIYLLVRKKKQDL